MVPHLIAVEKNQANGFPPGCGQSVPHIAAGGAAASIQRHLSVNGVAGGAGSKTAPWFNAVERIIRIGNTAVPGKMPAKVFDIRCSGCVRSVGLVSAGDLAVQNRGIVAVICIIKQHDTGLGTCQRHHAIFICHSVHKRLGEYRFLIRDAVACGFCRKRLGEHPNQQHQSNQESCYSFYHG